MQFEFRFTVRGYELDSYNHVNHAVYLNYYEQARWEILKKLELLDYFRNNNLLLIVSEAHVRYNREVKLFDELLIKSEFQKKNPYLVFFQKIYNLKNSLKVSQAAIKTLLIGEDRIPCEFPDSLLK